MTEEIFILKKLNAAFIASNEYDFCPDIEEAENIFELFDVGVSLEDLEDALKENQGRRADEIMDQISRILVDLN